MLVNAIPQIGYTKQSFTLFSMVDFAFKSSESDAVFIEIFLAKKKTKNENLGLLIHSNE